MSGRHDGPPRPGADGAGIEYAYTMVHKAPQSTETPQVVPKKGR